MTLGRTITSGALAGALALSTLPGNSLSAHAGDEGARVSASVTLEERQACTPDVLHLCKVFIPNRTAITGCLIDNIERLSPACRNVMVSRR
jgi:hypothetical protein